MPSTKDLVLDDVLISLVFGRFKTGKTWGALTFPRPNIIDFDHGIRTVLNPDFVKKYGVKNVEYYQPRRNVDSSGVPKDYNAIDEASRYFDLWMKPDRRGQFDTWILDSCTTLIDASTDKAIMLLGSTAFKGAGSSTYEEAKKAGLVAPKKQDYGAERSMTEQFVRMIKESGKNVVVIAHERELTDEEGNVKQIVPLLTGKSQEDIPIMFDEVYRLSTRVKGTEIIHVLETSPSVGNSAIRVGSRLGVPNGTPWNYESLKAAVDAIRLQQRKTLADAAAVADKAASKSAA